MTAIFYSLKERYIIGIDSLILDEAADDEQQIAIFLEQIMTLLNRRNDN